MDSRINKLLCGTIVACSLLFGTQAKAEPLPVSEQEVSNNSDNKDGILETIYDSIANGNTSINVSNDVELGIRPNIDVSDPPKQVVNNEAKSNTRSKASNSIGQDIANFARSLVGKPYVFGATGPNSFDCSGFVYYVYKNFGISLPRTSQSQAYVGERVSKSELQPGDLIFSNTYSSLSHVGVYIGNGKFVHAANSGTGVTISGVSDSYYGPRYAWSTRPY